MLIGESLVGDQNRSLAGRLIDLARLSALHGVLTGNHSLESIQPDGICIELHATGPALSLIVVDQPGGTA